MNEEQKRIVADFHKLFCESKVWQSTSWLGVPALKCPMDLWIYQEIIFETRPDFIIECGTHLGGSAAFMASICDLIGDGKIITVDNRNVPGRPSHPRITYILGSSTQPRSVEAVRALLDPGARVMVVLDSDHRKAHVLNEMRIYSNLVTDGQYLIVEDTNHAQLGVAGGPLEAVDEFLAEQSGFTVDKSREKFFVTFNPSGFLKKQTGK